MTREEYVKKLIKDSGKNVKEFSSEVDIPYTTMLSMLKNLGGSAVDSVIKICNGLGITVEQLDNITLNFPSVSSKTKTTITEKEQEYIDKYLELDEHSQSFVNQTIDHEYDRRHFNYSNAAYDGKTDVDELDQVMKLVMEHERKNGD